MEQQKIISLEIENFKRVRAVRIEPNGGVTTVSGRNGQGKSSTLDAIQAALGGKSAAPSKPVRNGAEKSTIVLELSDLTVTRTFRADGKDSLKVESKDGAKFASPQAMLDRLLGSLSFDPLDFERMKPKDQAETLRKLVGLDTSALDAEAERVYSDRTIVNREIKRIEGELSGITHHEDAPGSLVSVAALTEKLREAEESAANHRGLEHDVRNAESQVEALRAGLRRNRERRAELERLIAECDKEAAVIDANGREWAADVEKCKEYLRAHVVIDAEPIREAIANSEAINSKVRENARRAEVEQKLADARAESDLMTKRLSEIEREKASTLAGIKFPVDGLGIDGSTVTLDGVPFDQASQAQRLRASVAIGAATSPKLAAMLIRDGSRLDDESLSDLATLASEMGVQLIVERVGKGDAMGVVIEDGEIVGAESTEAA